MRPVSIEGISRLITAKFWNVQRVLHTLAATQEIPRHTRVHSRGSTRFPPSPRGEPFLPPSSRGGILSLRGRDRIPGFPVELKRRRSPQERREELQGRAIIPRVPQMSQSISEEPVSLHCLDFHAEDRLTPRWHVGQPCGKASWESLEGKAEIP